MTTRKTLFAIVIATVPPRWQRRGQRLDQPGVRDDVHETALQTEGDAVTGPAAAGPALTHRITDHGCSVLICQKTASAAPFPIAVVLRRGAVPAQQCGRPSRELRGTGGYRLRRARVR